nr:hypothetical protein CFP56_75801 [Quercus suber]
MSCGPTKASVKVGGPFSNGFHAGASSATRDRADIAPFHTTRTDLVSLSPTEPLGCLAKTSVEAESLFFLVRFASMSLCPHWIWNHPGILQLTKEDKDYVRRTEDAVENFLVDDSSSDENIDYNMDIGDCGFVTLGKTEIMAVQKKGDGEDNQLKRRLMEVAVVACVATVVKGFDPI